MTLPEKGRLAGIDFGSVRIGIAICDPDRIIASPYEIYVRRNEKRDAEYFKRFAKEERIVQFVVGLPLHLDGRLSEKAKEAQAFGLWLTQETGLPIDFMDERFTSVEANHLLRESTKNWRKLKTKTDKVAAQILLATYIERGCQGTTIFEALDDDPS